MKLAIAGKGGSGKTTVAGIMARMAARRGMGVLAIDADLNPNLACVLGLRQESRDIIRPLPPDLLRQRRSGDEVRLELSMPIGELLTRYGAACPDGVRLLVMGEPHEAGTGCMCSSHATVRGLLRELPADGQLVVTDMEASPEHLTRATPEAADALVVVAEPYFRSLEAARRQAVLAGDLGIARVTVIANKVRDPRDGEAIREFCGRHGLDLLGSVPYDTTLGEADRAGAGPVDHNPGAPAVGAIDSLTGQLLKGAA